jgi:hypothetical protein
LRCDELPGLFSKKIRGKEKNKNKSILVNWKYGEISGRWAWACGQSQADASADALLLR